MTQHYSDNPGHVRMDVFKPSGKWGYTEMLDMELDSSDYVDLTHDVTKKALLRKLDTDGDGRCDRFKGMYVVVLHPYVQAEFPVVIHIMQDGRFGTAREFFAEAFCE